MIVTGAHESLRCQIHVDFARRGCKLDPRSGAGSAADCNLSANPVQVRNMRANERVLLCGGGLSTTRRQPLWRSRASLDDGAPLPMSSELRPDSTLFQTQANEHARISHYLEPAPERRRRRLLLLQRARTAPVPLTVC